MQIYIIIGCVLALLAGVFRLDYLGEKAERLERDNKSITAHYNEALERADKTEKLRDDYLKTLQVAKDENQKLNDCISTGKCVRRVLVKSSCPSTQAQTTSGTQPTYAELDTATGQDISSLRSGLIDLESKYEFCRQYALSVSEPLKK